MAKDYFIADTHFGDKGIMQYENRPFATADEMDEALIKNWNEVVTEKDTVYVVGDFSAYYNDENKDKEILGKLKGTKILIMGNHDTHRSPSKWRELGFDECSSLPVVYNGFYLVSHEPMYINQNMPYANIFGHVHGSSIYKDFSPQSMCVSAERINYTPVSFDDIKEKITSA